MTTTDGDAEHRRHTRGASSVGTSGTVIVVLVEVVVALHTQADPVFPSQTVQPHRLKPLLQYSSKRAHD